MMQGDVRYESYNDKYGKRNPKALLAKDYIKMLILRKSSWAVCRIRRSKRIQTK